MRMTARERAFHLARAVEKFPLLGRISEEDLLRLIEMELGHSGILDGFVPYGSGQSFATPLSPILHIVSGNTPHAALQSLMRGLLLGAHNLVKIPGEGLPEMDLFHAALPLELGRCVEISGELPETWLERARALAVFGSDETIETFRGLAGSRVFQAHGHKVSFGVVFEDPDFSSVAGAARDVSLFDQQGCLSAQALYVGDVPGGPRAYARRLAHEMAEFEKSHPRCILKVGESAKIREIREDYRFRAASETRVELFESPGNDSWTVIYTEEAGFCGSCLNRVVFVKPLPLDFKKELENVRRWMGAIGIWPAGEEHARSISGLGASRICAIGAMQEPQVFWHQDGGQILAPFVQWVDFEKKPG